MSLGRHHGVSGKLRGRRQARRLGRDVDIRDVGVRPEVGKALGFEDADLEGPPEHAPDTCETFGCPTCGGAR